MFLKTLLTALYANFSVPSYEAEYENKEMREEIINEQKVAFVKELIAEGTFTAEKIAKMSKLPLEEVNKLIAEHIA